MDNDDKLNNALSLIEEITQLRGKAEEQFKAAEVARKNADSEGLFAVNAKRTCEEHSTAISHLKGVAESEINTISSNKQKADEQLAALINAKATVDASIKSIEDQRKESEAAIRSIKSALDSATSHLEELSATKMKADTLTKSISDTLDNATDSSANADAAFKQIEKYRDNAEQHDIKITESLQSIAKQETDIDALLVSAKEKDTNLKSIIEHLSKSDATSTEHETRVKKLSDDLESLIARVDGILPGATSASLASSFNSQKARFAKPQKQWLRTFIACILGLILVALPSFIAATFGLNILGHAPDSSTKDILKGLLLRLPIIIPLVWLAIYAGRNYMLSLRLEEEYAYKEAVSRAFEGYKREMETVQPLDPNKQSPLNTLCHNILAAIAERPGRIYEGKHHDITVMSETQLAANQVANVAKKQISTG